MRLELPSRLPRRTVIEGPSKIHRKHASMGFSRPIEAPSRILLDGHSCPADDRNEQVLLFRVWKTAVTEWSAPGFLSMRSHLAS